MQAQMDYGVSHPQSRTGFPEVALRKSGLLLQSPEFLLRIRLLQPDPEITTGAYA
jgi:hypothetical protein